MFGRGDSIKTLIGSAVVLTLMACAAAGPESEGDSSIDSNAASLDLSRAELVDLTHPYDENTI